MVRSEQLPIEAGPESTGIGVIAEAGLSMLTDEDPARAQTRSEGHAALILAASSVRVSPITVEESLAKVIST
jgi:hypothetical protein